MSQDFIKSIQYRQHRIGWKLVLLGNMNNRRLGRKWRKRVKWSELGVPGIFNKRGKIQKEDLHFGFMVDSLNAILLTSYYRPHKINKAEDSQIAHNPFII